MKRARQAIQYRFLRSQPHFASAGIRAIWRIAQGELLVSLALLTVGVLGLLAVVSVGEIQTSGVIPTNPQWSSVAAICAGMICFGFGFLASALLMAVLSRTNIPYAPGVARTAVAAVAVAGISGVAAGVVFVCVFVALLSFTTLNL